MLASIQTEMTMEWSIIINNARETTIEGGYSGIKISMVIPRLYSTLSRMIGETCVALSWHFELIFHVRNCNALLQTIPSLHPLENVGCIVAVKSLSRN